MNISLAKKGSTELGTRAEIKNLNSFRSVEMAVEYEYHRQKKLLDGEKWFRKLVAGMTIPGKLLLSVARKRPTIIATCQSQIFRQFIWTEEYVEAERAKLVRLPADYRAMLRVVIPEEQLEILFDHQKPRRKSS